MISEQDKSRAIAKLKHKVPSSIVANELDIPEALVNEWLSNMNLADSIALEANIHAVEQVLHGEIEGVDNNILKSTLEATALDIARQAAIPGISGDVMQAKALDLCASAVTRLYMTIILKNGNDSNDPSKILRNDKISAFQGLMRD